MVKYIKGFWSYIKVKRNRNLILTDSLFTTISIVFFTVFQKISENAIAEQTLHRQQLAARSGANSIKSFIDLVGMHIYHLSLNTEIAENTGDIDIKLKDFLESFSEYPVKDVIRTDSHGNILHSDNVSGVFVGEKNVSDRNYFKRLKNDSSRRYVISMPIMSRLGATENQYIVVAASPVIKDGKFDGIVATSILLADLTAKYLDPLKINEDTRVYLINDDGTILSSPHQSLIGVNYLDKLREIDNIKYSKTISDFQEALASETEAKFTVTLPTEYGELNSNEFLISESPIYYRSGGDLWLLAIASPKETIYDFLYALEKFSVMTLLYVIFTIIFLAIYNLQENRQVRKEAYKEGYDDGKKG